MKDRKTVFFGPASLVTAAMLGSATVSSASLAGAKYGFSLLWVVVLATWCCFVLQDITGRIGIATGTALAPTIRRAFASTSLRRYILGLTIIGIFVGNLALQSSNLIGAAGALKVVQEFSSSQLSSTAPTLTADQSEPRLPSPTLPAPISLVHLLLVAGLAWAVILIGRLDWIQLILTCVLILGGLTFLSTAFIARPTLMQMLGGLVPSVPTGSGGVIVGLLSSMLVPYSLLLHVSSVANRWPHSTVTKVSDRIEAVQISAKNTRFCVGFAGLIAAAVLISAAVASTEANNSKPSQTTADHDNSNLVGANFESEIGAKTKLLFGLGLLATSLASLIVASIASALAVAGGLGWPSQLSDWQLRLVASAALLIGFPFALLFGNSPQDAILIAQVVNGLLLPMPAILLLVIVNRVELVTRFHNRLIQNLMSILVVGIVVLIAAGQLLMVIAK